MEYSIYFVRHGQTILNRYNRMQGWCDSPLTEKGIQDGHLAGKRLAEIKFDHAFHSDTTRATKTCQYILEENQFGQNQTTSTVPEFREEGYGYFEGADSAQAWYMIGAAHECKSFKEIIKNYSIDAAKDFAKEADPFHEAENNEEFWERINRGFAQLQSIAKDGDKMLVVSHGTTIRSIVGKFGKEFDITVGPKNGSVTKLTIKDDEIKVNYYGQVDLDAQY